MKSDKKLALVFFPAFDWAISPTHPEREERLLYTQDQLIEEGIEDIKNITMLKSDIAQSSDVEKVHFCVPDVKSRVTESHLIAAGSAIRCADAVMKDGFDSAFALIRPPGHHAHTVVYGDRGFCIINNEAIMIEHMRKENPDLKVAIVDTDCHHGDGTSDIYWNDSNTLFISLHQDGRTLYPGTGAVDEIGGPSGCGYTINIPLPPGTSDEGYLYVIRNAVLPILDDFKPDIIINSAGQDNHYSDPLTDMKVSAQGYAQLNHLLHPDIAVLEGGYSIEGALPYVNLGIILAMAGLDYSGVKEPDYCQGSLQQSRQIDEYVRMLTRRVMGNWKNRKTIREQLYGKKDIVTSTKRIYYDTDNITERQNRKYILCDRCCGLEIIESDSDRHHSILAVTIGRGSCKRCVNKGYSLYKNASSRYTCVYLHDKVNDSYLSKKM